MWLLPLSLVLLSAGLHASWNLIVKSEDDKLFSGWLTVVAPAVLLARALRHRSAARRRLAAAGR
jgi:hypothetical protein